MGKGRIKRHMKSKNLAAAFKGKKVARPWDNPSNIYSTFNADLEEQIKDAKGMPFSIWEAINDPANPMTQEEYMERHNLHFEPNEQSKLWFGELWADRIRAHPWTANTDSMWDPAIDLPSVTVSSPSSSSAVMDTIDNICSTMVTTDIMENIHSRLTQMEHKIQELEQQIKDLTDEV